MRNRRGSITSHTETSYAVSHSCRLCIAIRRSVRTIQTSIYKVALVIIIKHDKNESQEECRGKHVVFCARGCVPHAWGDDRDVHGRPISG